MLSLWALFLLSAVVISWALDIDSRITISGSANRMLEAEAMACSGAEVALHPAVKPGSRLLKGKFDGNQTFEARITGEGGRLNLNWLVAGENPARLEILRKYLETKRVDLNERGRMIDCLLDWIDPDSLIRLNGAEVEGDYKPANMLLTRIDDLKRVRGWKEFVTTTGWDADFTLNSSGPIDVAWASREVLLSLPGMTEPRVEQFLTTRRGPDGIDGTEDDPPLKTLDEVRVALGFSAEQFKQLTGLVGFKDQVMRIVSVGRSGNATREVRMVVRKGGNIPQLISWKEL
ncbi:MAG: hypothetical protein ABI871_06725 [Chthoniobacterales bacterium]